MTQTLLSRLCPNATILWWAKAVFLWLMLAICLCFGSAVHQRSDWLCVGGAQPVRLPATGEPEDHSRHHAVRGPLFSGHLPQLPTGRLLRPEAAGPAQPHRYETWLELCSTFFFVTCDDLSTPEKFQASIQSKAFFLMVELLFSPYIACFLLSVKHVILADGAASKTFLLSPHRRQVFFLFARFGSHWLRKGKPRCCRRSSSWGAAVTSNLSRRELRLRVTFLFLTRLF